MNKKIASSIIAALVMAGSSSFMASAAMENGTIIIGNKAFELGYANKSENSDEINNSVIAGGEIYIKGFDGYWINNNTNEHVDVKTIPAVVYKSLTGVSNFDAADKDHLAVISVQSVSAINNVNVLYGVPIAKVAQIGRAHV